MKILISGASRGIGLAEATLFDSQGHELFLVASKLESFSGKGFEKHHLSACDMANPEEIEGLVQSIASQTDSLDILVNNVGVMTLKKFRDMSMDEVTEMLDVNLRSHILLTKYALPLLEKGANPQIVFMSSMAAKSSIVGESVYSATKGGVTNFASALRNEFMEKIKVSTVHAWGVDTFGADSPEEFLTPSSIAEAVDFMITRDKSTLVESIELSNPKQWRGGVAPWSPTGDSQ